MLQAATTQPLVLHAARALASEQALPQLWQLVVLLPRLTSQPFAALPSQSAKPALQVNPQVPELHAGTALATPGHTVPHMPQLAVSVEKLAQTPVAAQYVVPAGQELTQLEPAQRVPAVQAVPHMPQFVLVVVEVSQPSAGLPLQSA